MRVTMRITATIVALAFLACRTAKPPIAPAFGPGTEELRKSAHEVTAAFLQQDERKLESLLAPDYSFHFIDDDVHGSFSGVSPAPRARWPAALLKSLRIVPLSTSVLDARVYGPFGIVVTQYKASGSGADGSFIREGHITDVWVRKDNRWWLLSSTATSTPSAQW